jgi:hypothetical protein
VFPDGFNIDHTDTRDDHMIVSAEYRGKLSASREQRLYKAFDRCGVRLGQPAPMLGAVLGLGVKVTVSDVDWSSNDDETWHGLKIHVSDDERERAVRLASELRGYGMIVGIGSDDNVDW